MECCLAVQLIPTKELRVGLFSKAVALLTSGKNVQLFGPGNFSKVFNIKRISSLFSFFLTQSMNRCFQAYLTREMVITHMIGNYPARALRALGLLLADGAPTVGGGKTF